MTTATAPRQLSLIEWRIHFIAHFKAANMAEHRRVVKRVLEARTWEALAAAVPPAYAEAVAKRCRTEEV